MLCEEEMSKTQKHVIRDGEVPWLWIQPCRGARPPHQEQIWDAHRSIKQAEIGSLTFRCDPEDTCCPVCW